MATIAEALDIAVGHHRAGALPEAEAVYRQILAVEPRHPDALHLLGLIAHQVGRNDLAVELIGGALAVRPDFADAHCNLGTALRSLKRLDEALASFRRAVELNPAFASAIFNLGNTLLDLGRPEEAITQFRHALAMSPSDPAMHTNLGTALLALGRWEEAAAEFRAAIALDPSSALAHANLGNALLELGPEYSEAAETSFRRAIQIAPDHAPAHNNLGHVLQRRGLATEAAECCRRAIALSPGHVEAHNNLGNALKDLGRGEEALACYETALSLDPSFAVARRNLANTLVTLRRFDDAVEEYRAAIARHPHADACTGLAGALHEVAQARQDVSYSRMGLEYLHTALSLNPRLTDAYYNIGVIHKSLGEFDQAIEYYDQALELDPARADARLNRALAFFTAGRLDAAWKDYDARWKVLRGPARRPFPQPSWEGRSLDGKKLLVWGEQGLGDEILAAGMIPELIAAGGTCLYECERRLVPLFARSFPAVTVLPRSTPPDPRTSDADFQIPALDVAARLRTSVADFPGESRYLTADPDKARHWKTWLDRLPEGRKVGFTWKGRIMPERPSHFPPLAEFAVILRVPGLTFVNLQYDDSSEDIEAIRRDMGVEVHCPPGLDLTDDLDGVAALNAGLDGVVGLMTVAVVLAGALGRPAWVYADYPATGEMATCGLDYFPWCPSIRVEKRGLAEDYGRALGRIADGLRAFVAKPN